MRRNISTIYIIATVVLVLVFGLLGSVPLQWRWLLIMVTIVLMLALAGREITGTEQEVPLRNGRMGLRTTPGRFDGILIDSRNKITLSRLQLVLWSVVVLSAWATLALHRVVLVLGPGIPTSSTQTVEMVAKLLAGEKTPGAAETRRARAMLEQITGVEAPPAGEEGNATATPYEPLAVSIPSEVLLAMGISVASLVGAGLIKENKATNEDGNARKTVEARVTNANTRVTDMNNQANELEIERSSLLESMSGGLESADGSPATAADLAAAQAQLSSLSTELQTARAAAARADKRAADMETALATAVGELDTRPSSADARWSDMLRGDTVANYQYTDLGKIQMLLFTVILVFTYAALIWSLMSMPQGAQVLQVIPSISLPAFSQSLVTLMAISHGGYLVAKNGNVTGG